MTKQQIELKLQKLDDLHEHTPAQATQYAKLEEMLVELQWEE